MRLTFTGTHSTGKTSLLDKLKYYNTNVIQNYSYSYFNSLTRTLKENGFSINEEGSIETQILQICDQTRNITFKNFISDRCLFDVVAYTEYLFSKNKEFKDTTDFGHKMLNTFANYYDYIFYVPIEFDLKNDQTRSTNNDFQKQIDQIIVFLLKQYNVQYYTLNGSLDDRFNKIKNIINVS